MKCNNCGYEIENDKARKCPSCGARVMHQAKEPVLQEEEHDDDNQTSDQETLTPPVEVWASSSDIGAQTFDDPVEEEQPMPDINPLYEQPKAPAAGIIMRGENNTNYIDSGPGIDDNVRREDLDEYIDNGEYQPDEDDTELDNAHKDRVHTTESKAHDVLPKTEDSSATSWLPVAGVAVLSILIGALLYTLL